MEVYIVKGPDGDVLGVFSNLGAAMRLILSLGK